MRLIDADALCEEFKRRQRAASRWKEEAILADNEESKIRADAILSFLCEVKLTIDNAPTVETDIEVVAKDAYDHGYTDGWKERFGEPNERPQGEWIETDWFTEIADFELQCPICHEDTLSSHISFCPNCGAKLDLKRSEEE